MLRTPALVCVLRSLSVEKALNAIMRGADAVELRVDLLRRDERDVARVRDFVSVFKDFRCDAHVILTNRAASEGGSFEGTEEERMNLLAELMEVVDADAVDVEFMAEHEMRSEIIRIAHDRNASVILSFHDFSGMPAADSIENMAHEMHAEGADIAKIAVTPKTAEDALTLLRITLKLSHSSLNDSLNDRSGAHARNARNEKKVAIIGMGKIGKHTRVIAPIYGSALTYGFPDDDGEVAPGQLSISAMRGMLNALS